MAHYPFVINPQYTGLVIAYRNPNLIADAVAPRVPVADRQFKISVIPKGQMFTIPDTKVGRKGVPNKVEFSQESQDSSALDYGLEDDVPQDDIDAAARLKDAKGAQVYDPLAQASEFTADLLALDREKRTADLVFDANNYGDANKVTLAGNDQWSDFANSDPVSDILGALDKCIMRPNVMVLGQAVWTKLRTHPKIVSAILGNNGTSGIVSAEAVKQLFELEEILVGQGWVNTAKRGQATNLVRVWGKHCALIYRNKQANTQRGMTFALTAQYNTRVVWTRPNPDIGLRGGTTVRVGESVREYIMANDLGYFFENAVA